MWTTVHLRLVGTAARASTLSTTTNASAIYRTQVATAMRNWILVRPINAATVPNAHHPAISSTLPVRASWDIQVVCATKTLTNAPSLRPAVMAQPVKTATVLMLVFALKVMKVAIV